MPTTATAYSAEFSLPETVQRDLGATLTCPIYRDGAIVAVTAAGSTLEILRPDGTQLLAPAAVTDVGGVAQYTVTAGSIASEVFQAGLQFIWRLVLAGETHSFRNLGAICRFVPQIPAHLGSLIGRVGNLQSYLPPGQTSWQSELELAWTQIQRWLYRQSNRPNLIVGSSDLVDLHIAWSLWVIYEDLARVSGADDTFRLARDDFRNEVDRLKSETSFQYASDDGATPDEDRRPAAGTVFLDNGEDWYPGKYEATPDRGWW